MLFGNIKNASVKVCITILLFSHSVIPDSLQPHGLQHASSLSFTISLSLLKLMSVESVVPSNHILNGVKVLPLYQNPHVLAALSKSLRWIVPVHPSIH